MTCLRSSSKIKIRQTTSKSKVLGLQSSAKTASHLQTQNTFTVFRPRLQTVRYRDISKIITLTHQTKRMPQSHFRISFRCRWRTRIINNFTTVEQVGQFKMVTNKISQLDLHQFKQEISRRIWQK